MKERKLQNGSKQRILFGEQMNCVEKPQCNVCSLKVEGMRLLQYTVMVHTVSFEVISEPQSDR